MCFTSRHMIGLGPMGPTSRRKHLGKQLGGFSNSFQAIVQSLTFPRTWKIFLIKMIKATEGKVV